MQKGLFFVILYKLQEVEREKEVSKACGSSFWFAVTLFVSLSCGDRELEMMAEGRKMVLFALTTFKNSKFKISQSIADGYIDARAREGPCKLN